MYPYPRQGLVYDPEMGDRYNTDLLKKVMPELEVYDSAHGKWFRSRTVPSMKLLMHTHIDIIPGKKEPPPSLRSNELENGCYCLLPQVSELTENRSVTTLLFTNDRRAEPQIHDVLQFGA